MKHVPIFVRIASLQQTVIGGPNQSNIKINEFTRSCNGRYQYPIRWFILKSRDALKL